jgi:hypothetical protein
MATIGPKDALHRYAELALGLQTALKADRDAARPSLLRFQCQRVHDCLVTLPSVVLAIVHLHGARGTGPFAPAAKATLCMAMGIQMGLDPGSIAELGIVGLLHEAGTVELPDSTKSEAEWVRGFKKLPLLTTLAIGRERMTPAGLERIALAWEMSETSDADPNVATGFVPLVTVAAAYDRYCSPVAPGLGLMSSRAMQIVLFCGGRRYAESFARLLANTVGLYAPGAQVELNGNDRGVVVERPRDSARFDRPVVALGSDIVDLSEQEDRSIVRELPAGGPSVLSSHFLD